MIIFKLRRDNGWYDLTIKVLGINLKRYFKISYQRR
jgi:hypothetical protein